MSTVHFAYGEPASERLTPAGLARRFEDAHHAFIAMSVCLPLMARPGVIESAHQSLLPPTPNQIGLDLSRIDGTPYLRTTTEKAIPEAQKGLRFFLGGDLYKLTPMFLTIWLDNEINRTQLKGGRRVVRELELIRHLRNASAHGIRWYFRSGQPKYPAGFKGFEVTSALQGGEAFYYFMGPGDFLEMLDAVAVYLRTQ